MPRLPPSVTGQVPSLPSLYRGVRRGHKTLFPLLLTFLPVVRPKAHTVRTIPMDTKKAAYWIALGVLALGLSSEYRHGSFEALHRVAEHADVVLCRGAERTLAVARVLTSREGFAADNLLASANAAEMARDRAELLREQARDEAEILRENVRQRVGDGVRDSVREQIRAQAEVIRAQIDMQRIQVQQFRTAER